MLVGLTLFVIQSDDSSILAAIGAAAARDPIAAVAAAKLLDEDGGLKIRTFAAIELNAAEPGRLSVGHMTPSVALPADPAGSPGVTFVEQEAIALDASIAPDGQHLDVELALDDREPTVDAAGAVTLSGDTFDLQLSLLMRQEPLPVVLGPHAIAVLWTWDASSALPEQNLFHSQLAAVDALIGNADTARARRRLVDDLLRPVTGP